MFTGVRAFTCGRMCSHACLQVCVLCECVCLLQVTAGDSSHQNQAEPILYQAKENNHRYGRKLKIQGLLVFTNSQQKKCLSKELNLLSPTGFVSIYKKLLLLHVLQLRECLR